MCTLKFLYTKQLHPTLNFVTVSLPPKTQPIIPRLFSFCTSPKGSKAECHFDTGKIKRKTLSQRLCACQFSCNGISNGYFSCDSIINWWNWSISCICDKWSLSCPKQSRSTMLTDFKRLSLPLLLPVHFPPATQKPNQANHIAETTAVLLHGRIST